jgi:tripartite-type tricarboxylate transporter receptor subunit TctC
MWPALILVLLAHAVSDVLHHPFLGDTGDAATVDVHLTLWVPGTEAGGPSEAVAREAAASLQLTGRPATVKLVRTGGAAGAVSGFLGERTARPTDLLVVSSATVADLARGRADAVFGDEAAQAADAAALLRRARPLAILAQDRLQLAVRTGSHLRTGAQLMAALRTNPRSHLLAVEGDAWTKVNLGRLVQRAGVPGRVPYRAFPSAGEAALGLESGDADVVLAPSSELRAEVAGGRLRVLPWPSGYDAAPRAWTALLEVPGLRPGQHARLRDELARLAADPHWRRVLRRAGRAAPRVGAPRGFLADRLDDAAWLQRMTAHIERD